MRRRHVAAAAHFAEAHAEASLGELPGGLRSGETAADDVNVEGMARHCEELSDEAIHCNAGLSWSHHARNDRGNHAHLHHRLRGHDRARVPRCASERGRRAGDRRSRAPAVAQAGLFQAPLCGALAEAGIEYVHLKALGTPAEGRTAARAGRHADLERIYAGQLELPEAMAQAAQMLELAREKPSALLCMEREPTALPPHAAARAVAPMPRSSTSTPDHIVGQLVRLRLADRAGPRCPGPVGRSFPC